MEDRLKEIKKEIKVLKQERKDLKDLTITRIKGICPTGWYTQTGTDIFIYIDIPNRIKYGFNVSCTWFISNAVDYIHTELLPIDPEEALERLTKEAIKRGLSKGVRIVSPNGTDYGITIGAVSGKYKNLEGGLGYGIGSVSTILMSDGKWATPCT